MYLEINETDVKVGDIVTLKDYGGYWIIDADIENNVKDLDRVYLINEEQNEFLKGDWFNLSHETWEECYRYCRNNGYCDITGNPTPRGINKTLTNPSDYDIKEVSLADG